MKQEVVEPAALITGWVVDLLVGDPIHGHPVAAFGRAAQALERVLWRPSRFAGAVHVALLVGPIAIGASAVDRTLKRRPGARFVLTSVATWAVIGGRSLGQEANRLANAVAEGDLEEARSVAPALVGRDPSELDGPELCRAAVESVAENTADAVVAPLLWSAAAGPAGAIAYRAANTLDAMIGHHDDRYDRFGWAAARLDDVLTWPAARVGALLTVALAPFVGGNARRAWTTLRRYGDRHPSPNAGRMEAAFAGALGIRLGGRNRYGDRFEERPVLGEGPRPGVDEVRRAVELSRWVATCAVALSAALAWRIDR